jgi:thioredoxin reductase (NADPH)
VFVFAGYRPQTEFLAGLVELDEQGHILTDENLKTNHDGIYAAGDVRRKNLRQMVTAAADGAIAATELERYTAAMREQTGLVPQPVSFDGSRTPAAEPVPGAGDSGESAQSGPFTAEMRAGLAAVFAKMESPLELRLHLDDRPVSTELKAYMTELVAMTDRLTLSVADEPGPEAPSVAILRGGTPMGMAFHGVPGGHEFNSFVIALYNAAGPGQPLDDASRSRVAAIDEPTNVKVFVSLSCTMCPTTVMAAQQIAALNPNVTAEVYDLNHFPALRQQYSVMSVPCLVVNDVDVHFGKMPVAEVLDALGR